MRRLYGLDMRLPAGKLSGFYAQIVKGIAERASLFDRHQELLIFEERGDLETVREFLARYRVEADPCELLLAPTERMVRKSLFEDYAIVTRENRVFFDAALVDVFRLTQERPEAEPAPALQQLEDHLIAEVTETDRPWHVIDRQLAELADRVARAYGCGTERPHAGGL